MYFPTVPLGRRKQSQTNLLWKDQLRNILCAEKRTISSLHSHFYLWWCTSHAPIAIMLGYWHAPVDGLVQPTLTLLHWLERPSWIQPDNWDKKQGSTWIELIKLDLEASPAAHQAWHGWLRPCDKTSEPLWQGAERQNPHLVLHAAPFLYIFWLYILLNVALKS